MECTYLERVDQQWTTQDGSTRWAGSSPGDNKRACRSQLHLSKHLTRAIHKQSFALTHFLPRNAFSFYPLGLRGTASFACRVPLFVSGNSCILPQCATKGRDITSQQECPFCLTVRQYFCD